ncbi:MAG: hypothetical protein JWO90_1007 [Solirubrobacterales bacterium]|jgi:hypothetical protein|nr:hypothetical protein [Solirubrobacterales bacterium]
MRFRLAALLALLVLGALAPAAQAKPLLGFADQKPSMFSDPRFLDLGLKHARVNVPWDVLQEPTTLANLDAWMIGATIARVTPLLTIDRSRRAGMQSRNPTAGTIYAQVRKWRQRWPGQVTQVSSWNEGNINKRPELVAQWYRAILRACPGCLVMGADVVDRGNAGSWARRLVKAARREPKAWGLHNYIDANTFTTKNTTAFLKAVKGEVWLTETGGVLSRKSSFVKFKGKGPSHASRATSYTLKTLAKVDTRRIKRIYLYSWSTAPNDKTWDSGVIGPDGRERPALRQVRCYLGACGAKRPYVPLPVPAAGDDAQPTGP